MDIAQSSAACRLLTARALARGDRTYQARITVQLFNLSSDSAEQRFFTSPWAFVLGTYDSSGKFRPVTEKEGHVPCHLSPVEALIEAAHLQRLGMEYHVTHASMIDHHWFLDADGKGYAASIHLGWPACNGALLTRPSGGLAAYVRQMHHWTDEPPLPPTFEVDPDVLSVYSRVRECAGLYAWAETHATVLQWNPSRLAQVAWRALSSIGVTRAQAVQANQLAMFDPEFEQWHFVARDAAETAPGDRSF